LDMGKKLCVVRVVEKGHNTTYRITEKSLLAMVDLLTKMYLKREIEGFTVGWK